jgi:phosphoglycolate phosphatase
MDGTMWNATESYAKIWNETCASFGIDAFFSGADLEPLMGMSIENIMERLLGEHMAVDKADFLKVLGENEDAMMPKLGGILYPGVKESLDRLHDNYRLFMLSNCSSRGLLNFVNYTGTAHFFEGLLTQGERPVEKCENLRFMAQKYSLKSPAYVGDTQADCEQAHEAGMPFVFASWGFGECINAEWRFVSIEEMTKYFLKNNSLQ